MAQPGVTSDVRGGVPEADFHIVGASFAGSLLASLLAPHGRVVLIDRRLPGTRLKCAGGLPLATLHSLGVEIPFVPIHRAMLALRGQIREFPRRYATVDRRQLDLALFGKATAAGARFIMGEWLGHDPSSCRGYLQVAGVRHEFSYRKLILAHGCPWRPVESAATWRRPRRFAPPCGLALTEMIAQESPWPDALLVDIPDELSVGYAWVFPAPEGRLNVGVGTFADRQLSPRLLAACKERLGITGRVLVRGGGLLPLRPASRVMDGDTILFGDAAGMAYPLNGEGLAHIARAAPLWRDAILDGHGLNRRWRRSATCRQLLFGAFALEGLIFGEKVLHLPAYRWATRLSAWARKRMWPAGTV